MRKYIFVVGGVMSSVGKGVASASIGKILQSRGYRVANLKADMYVNLDAGTIRPAEHGEVFVGEDGIEADQDLGNYERFTNQICTREDYVTTGQVYAELIRRERNLEFGGEDVEVVPDVPNEIIRRIKLCQKKNKSEITIVEYGGTVGEYQLLIFLEAARMMKAKNPGDVFCVLVSFLPTPRILGEQKSKPTQYAIQTLNSAGINPDFIICRSEAPVTDHIKKTINTVCSLPVERIVSAPDVHSIYDVPVNLEKEKFGDTLLKAMNLRSRRANLKDWAALSRKVKKLSARGGSALGGKKPVKIGIVGKYFNFKSCKDTYISVIESVNHAAWAANRRPEILWLDSEKYETDRRKLKELDDLDGIIVPGGFGSRGIEGMILAADYARRKRIPYLGLCLGMQIMVISYARNVLGLKKANSTEFAPKSPHPLIATMADQVEKLKKKDYGATMRLGAYSCVLTPGTVAYGAYRQKKISERHRHRYEVNNAYVPRLVKKGLVFSGKYQKDNLMEIAELPKNVHPFYLGTQFHPEFKSRPLKPHPLFLSFIKASLGKK
ncbi:MAG: CTP synthase [Candidatus Brennerbacteria bacterium]|nr:CTP synthase [Candidatus Brennerbacteria bacterium]